MGKKMHFAVGRPAVDRRVCREIASEPVCFVQQSPWKWLALTMLSVPLLQGCNEQMEEFFEESRAIVGDRLNFFASFDDVMYAWDVRIDGGVSIPFCHITMQSTADGRVWSGQADEDGGWSFRGPMAPGEQTLTFRIRSNYEQVVEFQYDVVIRDNSAPNCQIVSPGEGEVYRSGEPVAFVADNADPEDDALLSLWTSDLEGGLIEGEEWTMSLFAQGQHQILLEAVDEFGAACTDTVSIWVE